MNFNEFLNEGQLNEGQLNEAALKISSMEALANQNSPDWESDVKYLEKELKRLKVGKVKVSRGNKKGKEWTNTDGMFFVVRTTKPVVFQDGHIGLLKITLNTQVTYKGPKVSFTDDATGPGEEAKYGAWLVDLPELEPVSKEALAKHKSFLAVKKYFPKSKMLSLIHI